MQRQNIIILIQHFSEPIARGNFKKLCEVVGFKTKRVMSYDDNVLIKLRRDYSKDEVVLHLINVVKESKIEIGKLSSYVDELKHRIEIKNNEIKGLNKKIVNARQIHKVKHIEEKIKKTNRENEVLKLKNKELREKLQLKDECSNLT